jgi:pyroglutamyl-peptidase
VNELTKSLRKIGHDVVPSDDAGRFVCNYVYYHSLRFAEQHGIKSLFVHVPLFLTIDEEVQMHFAASLLELLACSN